MERKQLIVVNSVLSFLLLLSSPVWIIFYAFGVVTAMNIWSHRVTWQDKVGGFLMGLAAHLPIYVVLLNLIIWYSIAVRKMWSTPLIIGIPFIVTVGLVVISLLY
ncbi:MAG TPA: hypothetical protein DCM08_14385 [Microscillaceae bacterium]|jgi:hypothetical protein|nr:hypothetical protein [Microscillaceae bacterium]